MNLLTETERAMLRYALELAQDQIYSKSDEFTEADQVAVTRLRELTEDGS